jgi:hypothetical protein
VTSPAVEAVKGGLRLGRVLGVPVFVNPSWLLFAAFVLLSFGPTLADDYGTTRGYFAAGAFAVLLLISVLLHEIGHCVVARAFGLPVRMSASTVADRRSGLVIRICYCHATIVARCAQVAASFIAAEEAESPAGRKAPFVISPVGLSRSGQLLKRGHGFASSAQ